MSVRRPAFRSSPSNPSLGEIQTVPERIKDMPYAPAIRVEAPGDLLFISGATPSPLYHKHPHELHEHNHPVGIADQTRLAMENIKTILDHQGLAWTDVVKVTKYLTDMRDMDGMVAVLAAVFRRLDAGQHHRMRQPALDARRAGRARHDRRLPETEVAEEKMPEAAP